LPWGLVTNGYLLKGEVRQLVAGFARFVRVSLDSGTNETHLKLHRPKTPQFDQILDNMAETIKMASVPKSHDQRRAYALTVGASFCVTDENWQEIGLCCSKLKAIGADYIEIRPTYPTTWRGDGWGLALNNVTAARGAIEDARASFQDETFQIIGMVERFDSLDKPEKPYKKCQIGPLMSVLGADGRLWHCCVQRGMKDFELSSVINQSFADAWAEAQTHHMSEKIDVKGCPRCRYDLGNLALEGIQRDAFHFGFV
jgi:sulfatase maturation enzyme AslB (radical SAM superfamily)